MAKEKAELTELADIKHDLDSLKTNVVELTKHLKKNGSRQAEKITDQALDQIRQYRELGTEKLHDVEKYVKTKPAQSLATAFMVGFVASILMGRK
jgi:ElaB/YqjD/DUF883 family membrane-anchored ribosome-binding protein